MLGLVKYTLYTSAKYCGMMNDGILNPTLGHALLLTTHDISSLNNTNTQVDIEVLDFS